MSMTSNVFEDVRQGLLVTAGNINDFNTMTIGWGTYGCLWSKEVYIVFVKPCRYTYEFMEKNEYFTVTYFDDCYKKEIMYLGSHSGRDENKVEKVGFHPIDIDGVAVGFNEAKKTLVLKKIFWQDLDKTNMPKEVIDKYYNIEEPHRVYVGEVVSIF